MKLVELIGERIMASSLDIAKHFGTRHFNILRAIRNLECSEEFKELNFLKSSYKSAKNNYVYYNLTFAGLFLLLTSFTGKESIKVKEYLTSQIQDLSFILKALENFEIPEDLPDLYLYLIKEEGSSNYKIGISKDPETRLKQLQTGNSNRLALVYTTKAENRYKEERKIHKILEAYKLHGEWFNLESKEIYK